MLGPLLKLLLKLRNADRIPRLPRGMLATDFEAVSRDERRVLARLGARSPSGIPVAQRRAGAENMLELVRGLHHFRPRRYIGRRISRMLGRLLHATDFHPHKAAVLEDARLRHSTARCHEIEARLKEILREVSRD